MLIRNAKIDDDITAVRFAEVVQSVGALQPEPGEEVLDAQGAVLLPGLHDHHIHLRALAARRTSIDLSHSDPATLPDIFNSVPGDGWIRGFGYHADRLGEWDRRSLDELCSTRPVRVQHSSGKMWVLNTMAMESLAVHASVHEGVEVENGNVTGRLFRMDEWLANKLSGEAPELGPVIAELVGYGITSVTDTSVNNDVVAEQQLSKLAHPLGGRFAVHCMGDETLVGGGQLKVMLDEDRLPDLDFLNERVREAHEQSRGVAFHCVSRSELLVAMVALTTCGVAQGDRIEHGGIVGEDMIADLAALHIPVVTQPGFLADRGDRFRREVDADELGDLYRYRSLVAAGIQVICSSDAPYGPSDPWVCMQAAQERRTESGAQLNPAECVDLDEALSGYLYDADLQKRRKIEAGAVANLVLNIDGVRRVWLGGQLVSG